MKWDNKVDQEIAVQINSWFDSTLVELDLIYGSYLNDFYKTPARKQSVDVLNHILKKEINLTLNQIFPTLYFYNSAQDFSKLNLFIPGFYTSKLSNFLRKNLTIEEQLLFCESEFKSYLKRYYLLGKFDWEIAKFIYVFQRGYNALEKHYMSASWQLFQNELEKFENGIYGIGNSDWTCNFNAEYVNRNQEKREVWLGGFENKSIKDMNYFYGPMVFRKFDNLDLNEFMINRDVLIDYLDTYNFAENQIRKQRGLPMLGEGWISETQMFYAIKERFGALTPVIHHGRPNWLGRQHFDVYLPEFNVAIEYQGEQHYRPIDFFGGQLAFEKNKARDVKKRELSILNNCSLIEVDKSVSNEELLYKISQLINKIKN